MNRGCRDSMLRTMITKLTLLLIVLVGAKKDEVISNLRSSQSCAYATGKLLRVSGSKAIYLVQNCTLRLFPDAATFSQLGYDFSDVIVMNDGEHCLALNSLQRLKLPKY